MTEIAMGPHPEFDALSAYADLDAAHAARSRVGRHVASCPRCRGEIAEIRALGAAARAIEVERAGSALWEKIRTGAAADGAFDVAASRTERAVVIEPARDEQHSRSGSPAAARSRRPLGLTALGGGAALVIALVALALWPSRSSLNASGTSRLTFTPGRPVPGGMMTVRYQPAPWLAGAPRLVLAGRYLKPAPEMRRDFVGARDGLDSLATLRPAADGSYEARIRLPDDFLGVRMIVFDSTGDASDRDGLDLWVAIGGQRDHSPSLAAFIASFTPANGRQQSRQSVSVADSIQHYFPGHPAGWSLYERYGVRKGVLDLFGFFSSAEKRYASLDDALWPKRALDAEQSWAMVSLASKISEPGEEAKWAQRLAREHPGDPRAFHAIAGMVHGIELRDPPHVADSIRPWLSVLDSLYLRSHPALDPYSYDLEMFRRQGDSAQKAGWSRRMDRMRPYFTRGEFPDTPDMQVESEVRRRLAVGCARPSGKFPLPDVGAWKRWCAFDHTMLWEYLAKWHLTRGEPVLAETMADSAIALSAEYCSDRMALRTRGDAKLARADTAGAARDYAAEFGRWKVQKEARLRAESMLGPRFDPASFDASADAAWRETLACQHRSKQADSTRQARSTIR